MATRKKDARWPESVHVRSREELERKLLEGLASPLTEMTKADWKRLRDRIKARAKRP